MQPRHVRVPSATYRVQFTKDFTFRDAAALVDYWHALGVSDLYASPFLKARPGSTHGYDVIDPRVLNPEIGTEEDLAALTEALTARGMGMVMDVVPNHMCVNTNDNPWWNNVLENGPGSPYAKYFDIDWRPPKTELSDKVLLPVLGDQYGKILESGELQIREREGAFFVEYYDHRYPIGPGTYPYILKPILAVLQGLDGVPLDVVNELESIITAAARLPLRSDLDPERVRERQREKEIIKSRLAKWLGSNPLARTALERGLHGFNGEKGQPRSFDALEHLLSQQAYRLSFWRVAAEQINYRRFFDINDLAAIRVEEPEVLASVHAKPFEFLQRGWLTGLRIDHVDGLREPRRYLDNLREQAPNAYVVVEKILASDERLPRSWATEGTSGYEFLNVINGLLVARAGEKALRTFYDGFRTVTGSLEDILYECKRLILRTAMASELSVLARRLARISEQHRWSRDFTIGTLEQVLADTIACFPVYRTYIGQDDTEVSLQDTTHVRAAIHCAQKRNPAINESAFAFLADLLLMKDPEGLDEQQRAARRDFILRFQQITGPVMAKGLEDTTFYRYFPLLSLNEVGGEPKRFGLTSEEFHRLMEMRGRERSESMSATSTHDTKRGEDSRTRLNVLSELPQEWIAAVESWRRTTERLKTRVGASLAPDGDDEYYIFQTIVAAMPPASDDSTIASFRDRVCAAVEKAAREAKRNTTWVNPNKEYEDAMHAFVGRVLDPRGPLLPEVRAFVDRISSAGYMSSLVQLVLKATLPGVPDFYQGTELWDLSMVDPDNRRSVDFAARRQALWALRERAGADRAGLIRELWASAHDGQIKVLLTHTLLDLRRTHGDLFTRGAYVPLEVDGDRREQVIAFARRWQGKLAIIVTGRFFAEAAGSDPTLTKVAAGFARTAVLLPPELRPGALHDAITGRPYEAGGRSEGRSEGRIDLGDVFGTLPFAVLIGDVAPPRLV
ncbi:MAG TPA: malto-oligosyltrehalose synthase [Polyangia bacterium]